MTYLELLLINGLINSRNLFTVIAVILGFVFVMTVGLIFAYIIQENQTPSKKEWKLIQKILTLIVLMLIGSTLMSVFIPTREQVAQIVVIKYLSESGEAKKLPDNLLKTLNISMEEVQEWIKDDATKKDE